MLDNTSLANGEARSSARRPLSLNSLLVGFESAATSLDALRWALHTSAEHGGRLTVVHATTVPIAIRNGPSASEAERLGSPPWALVDSTVRGLGGADRVDTIVHHGRPHDVFTDEVARAERNGEPFDAIVLGPHSAGSGWRRVFRSSGDLAVALRRSTGLPVLRIDDSDLFPAHRLAADAELERTAG